MISRRALFEWRMKAKASGPFSILATFFADYIKGVIILLRLGLICAFLSGWCSAAQIPVDEILKTVSQTYSNLQALQFVAVRSFEWASPGRSQSKDSQIALAVVKPGKVRLMVKDPEKEVILVSDGETTWTYLPKQKQYTKESVASSAEAEETEPEEEGETDLLTEMQNLLVGRYRGLSNYAGAATLAKEDRLKLAGTKLSCYVIQLRSSKGLHVLWVDKDRFLVLRHSEESRFMRNGVPVAVKATVNLKEADIGALPEKSLFEFSPPEKAREVQALDLPGMRANLTGNVAADFTLKDLEGTQVSLSDFGGKIVLLDFWATWCGPCRQELPCIEKLHLGYKDKDVVILGVNDEDSGSVKSFLRKNEYTFPVLMDSKHAVHKMYAVRAIPTVFVIDRKGVVVAHYVGGRSEEVLTGALKAAGL